MCCASRKVQLPETPPEPLNGLLIGTNTDSNLFLNTISTFNSCFQMTSFGAKKVVKKKKKLKMNICYVIFIDRHLSQCSIPLSDIPTHLQ